MYNLLAYRETGAGVAPRHPLVCYIDLLGIAITASLLLRYGAKPAVAVLPIAMIVQYAVSCLYHWLPYHPLRQQADCQMIVLLIAATFIPYWGTLLPASEMQWRLPTLACLTAAICVIKWFRFTGSLYLALGAFGLTISFNELQIWLPPLGFVGFWVGTGLYLAQFAVHMMEWPNLVPELFGYREVQHLILVGATTLHSLVVLIYL